MNFINEVKTSKVYLRKFKYTDINDVYEYQKQEDLSHFSGFKAHKNRFNTFSQVSGFIKFNDTFAICDNLTDKVIGSISLRIPENYYESFDDSLVMGFLLNPSYFRKGIMSELILNIESKLCRLNYKYLYAAHFHYNDACKYLLEKLDYSFYKKDLVYIFSKEDFLDVCFYYKKL